MALEPEMLVPYIRNVLNSPGTDLATVSGKRVRKQLLETGAPVTAGALKENKATVDALIASVYEDVVQERKANDANGGDSEKGRSTSSTKRERVEDEAGGEGDHDNSEIVTPRPKRVKKAAHKEVMTDEELARALSKELNARSTRAGTGSVNGSAKKVTKSRKKKSATTVNSDGEETDEDGREVGKRRKKSSGGAKGGFAKEFALSEPLATVLQVDKMSRPQVVKNLWVYIKTNELQNPRNKREIICDIYLKAVFGVDKIDMFKMNKLLGQHLLEDSEV